MASQTPSTSASSQKPVWNSQYYKERGQQGNDPNKAANTRGQNNVFAGMKASAKGLLGVSDRGTSRFDQIAGKDGKISVGELTNFSGSNTFMNDWADPSKKQEKDKKVTRGGLVALASELAVLDKDGDKQLSKEELAMLGEYKLDQKDASGNHYQAFKKHLKTANPPEASQSAKTPDEPDDTANESSEVNTDKSKTEKTYTQEQANRAFERMQKEDKPDNAGARNGLDLNELGKLIGVEFSILPESIQKELRKKLGGLDGKKDENLSYQDALGVYAHADALDGELDNKISRESRKRIEAQLGIPQAKDMDRMNLPEDVATIEKDLKSEDSVIPDIEKLFLPYAQNYFEDVESTYKGANAEDLFEGYLKFLGLRP